MKWSYIVFFSFVTLTIGCTKKTYTPAEPGKTASDSRDLVAYEDKARGVVCYRVQGRDGLSCIKMENR